MGTDPVNGLRAGGLLNITTSQAVVDDFEDGDISEYSEDTGNFAALTNTVKNGTYSLECTASGTNSAIVSTSGLNRYPSQGDTFRWWVRDPEPRFPALLYGAADGNNTYVAQVQAGQDEWELRKISGGSISTLVVTTVSLSTSTWYECEVEWRNDDTHVGRIFDPTGTELGSWTHTDSEFSGNSGVGFRNDQTAYWDYVRIV